MAFRRIGTPSTLTNLENQAAKTRCIVGDGTGFLKVPGLLLLSAVAVATASGRIELPLSEERLIMVHPDDQQPREKETEELFELDTTSYDGAVLLRSELSNGGIWQKGVDFYITGDWAEDGAAAPTPSTPPVVSPPSTDTNATANTDKVEDNEPSFADSFESLPDELKAKIAKLGSLDAAREAVADTSNALFKAVGITGPEIAKSRNALNQAIAAEDAQDA